MAGYSNGKVLSDSLNTNKEILSKVFGCQETTGAISYL